MKHLIGIFMLPVAACWILSFRLAGVPVTYRWGDTDITARTEMTQGQYLLGRVLPAVVATPIIIVLRLLVY